MIELGREKRQVIGQMCSDCGEVLVRGAVQGVMGQVWVPELKKPSYCLILQGDFAYLLGVTPKGEMAMDLRVQILETCGHAFITPMDERWKVWLEENFQGEYRMVTRYAMKRNENRFDKETLKSYAVKVPDGIKIKPIDKKLYNMALKEEWSRDFCSNFDSAEDFMENGLGFVAMEGRRIVSGCSAYGRSQGMLEIEVGTRKEYQRKGLALSCGANFILSCMEQGIYPNWDAANQKSVGLAEKLGYVFDREYLVYQLIGEEIAC